MTSIKKIMLYFFVVVLTSLSSINSSKAYIPIFSEIKNSFDNEVKKTSQSMAAGIRQEYQKAANHLFDEKIKPLLDEIDLVAKNRMKDASGIVDDVSGIVDDVSATVNKVNEIVQDTDKIVKDRLDQLNEIINKSMSDIRKSTKDFKKIIEDTSKSIDQLRDKFKKDIDDIFAKIDNIIDCKITGTHEKIIMDIKTIRDSFIPRLPFLKPPCYKVVGISADPQYWEYTTIYGLEKCRKLKQLDDAIIKGNTITIDTILKAYVDLRALCARVGCVQRHAGDSAAKYFGKEYLELGRAYDIWENTQSGGD